MSLFEFFSHFAEEEKVGCCTFECVLAVVSVCVLFLSFVFVFIVEFQEPDNTDPRYIHKGCDRVCCYLPMSCQRIHRYIRKVCYFISNQYF